MMEETIVLTVVRGFLRRLAKKPMTISCKEVNVSLEGYKVRIKGIEKVVIDAKKEAR